MGTRGASGNGRLSKKSGIERLEAANLDLRRTLQILEDARANLADQYDFAPIGFVTLDDKGCIREMNLTAARMLGRTRSRLLTMPFLLCAAKPDRKVFLDHMRACRNQQGEVIHSLFVTHGKERDLAVELRSVPVLNEDGKTVYRTAMTEIGARLRADAALRESEERYRDLIEHSPDGIFILDEGFISFANPAAMRICGAGNQEELIGREMTEWVHPSYRKAILAMLRDRRPDTLETTAIEAQFVRSDQADIDVEMAARRFRRDGEPGVIVVVRDISRRKSAERHVLAVTERERRNFGRDLHDSLSQNLMGVSWRAEALRNGLRETHPAAADEADAIARTIRQCMNEARSLAKGLCPVALEKSGLVAALHEFIVEVTHRARIGCTLECDDLLTVEDVEVATNLYRITQEAVANAIKHGKAKKVLIQLGSDSEEMTLRVHDDGKGFPERPNQTGMGLHTMRYRASMIGGVLDVRRKGARGTLVTCSFPIQGRKP